MSRMERAAKGLLAGYTQFLVLLPLQFALAPVILKTAGKETLGAFQAVMQLVGYLGLVELGLPETVARFAAREYRDGQLTDAYLGTLRIGRFISLGANSVMAGGLFVLSYYVGELLGLESSRRGEARLAVQLYAGWMLLRALLSPYQGGLIASQQLAFTNIAGLLGNIVRLVAVMGLTAMGFGLAGMMMALVLAEALVALASWYRFAWLYPGQHLGWKTRERALVGDMLRYTAGAVLVALAWRLIYQTDNLVVGTLFGASAVGVYYATQMPATMGIALVNVLANSTMPGIYQMHGQSETVSMRKTLVRLLRLTIAMGLGMAVGLIILNRAFVSLWVGPGMYAGTAMTVALGVFLLFNTTHRAVMVFLLADGKVGFLGKVHFV